MPDKRGLNSAVVNMMLVQMTARQCDAVALEFDKQGHQIIKQLQIWFVSGPRRPSCRLNEGAEYWFDAIRWDVKQLQYEIGATGGLATRRLFLLCVDQLIRFGRIALNLSRPRVGVGVVATDLNELIQGLGGCAACVEERFTYFVI